MFTFRTTADVPDDRQVIVHLPQDAPTGKAQVVVTVEPEERGTPPSGSFRDLFGTVNSGNPNSSDNKSIDADLARAYLSTNDE